jgi:hypothetical protein
MSAASISRTMTVVRLARRTGLLACLFACVLITGCNEFPDSINIPVRVCAIEGSPQAMGLQPGDSLDDFDSDLLNRVESAGEIWRKEGGIFFTESTFTLVIADPFPEGLLGDIDLDDHPFEPMSAADECKAAWRDFEPQQKGLTVVNARGFVNAGLAFAVVNPVTTLQVNGTRGDDLCGHPRQLTVADVAQTDWAVMVDHARLPSYEDSAIILAHEFGHMLMLDHGNGLDDNHDGLEPPDEGPRRFDGYCDPLGYAGGDNPAEDPPFTGCEDSSLMYRVSSSKCTELRPLQVEQAKEVARLIPGVSVGGHILDND